MKSLVVAVALCTLISSANAADQTCKAKAIKQKLAEALPWPGLFLPQEFEPKAFRTGCGRGGLVSVAGLRDMTLGERAAEVELTEGRVTPNIKTPIAFIQAGKFGGRSTTARCARDGLMPGSAVGHGDGQDHCHDDEDCGNYERQQLHEWFPPNGKYRPQFLT